MSSTAQRAERRRKKAERRKRKRATRTLGMLVIPCPIDLVAMFGSGIDWPEDEPGDDTDEPDADTDALMS